MSTTWESQGISDARAETLRAELSDPDNPYGIWRGRSEQGTDYYTDGESRLYGSLDFLTRYGSNQALFILAGLSRLLGGSWVSEEGDVCINERGLFHLQGGEGCNADHPGRLWHADRVSSSRLRALLFAPSTQR